jgi:DNA-binding CsgD family transcriptional regulator
MVSRIIVINVDRSVLRLALRLLALYGYEATTVKRPAKGQVHVDVRLSGRAIRFMPRSLTRECLLTERECIVLALIVKGASSKEAARALGISPRTVDFHRANMMQKLGAKNAADLVRKVLSDR